MVETKVTSFRTGLMSGEVEVVEMQNDLLRLSILAGRGADLVEIIFYEACLTEGEIIENPCDFVNKINKILSERL